ncbi:uncharacterized protein DS421_15g508140 [Arachis hypogaea]|nr:uncharacterized protein DS421_15g508140 [Arachis hypogaea]
MVLKIGPDRPIQPEKLKTENRLPTSVHPPTIDSNSDHHRPSPPPSEFARHCHLQQTPDRSFTVADEGSSGRRRPSSHRRASGRRLVILVIGIVWSSSGIWSSSSGCALPR